MTIKLSLRSAVIFAVIALLAYIFTAPSSFAPYGVAALSVASLLGMIFTSQLKIDKSAWALLGGFVTWLIAIQALEHNSYQLMSEGAVYNIFGVVVFLFAAMTIVEGVDHHGGFGAVTRFITATNKDKLVAIVAIFTFFLSAALDNLTTSIVMGSLVIKLMKGKGDQLTYAGIVVIAANIGGVWSPIGNTTSILLWVGGQMSAYGMVTSLFFPSLVSLSLLIFWFMWKMNGNVSKPELEDFSVTEDNIVLPTHEKALILGIGLICLLFAPAAKIVWHMEP